MFFPISMNFGARSFVYYIGTKAPKAAQPYGLLINLMSFLTGNCEQDVLHRLERLAPLSIEGHQHKHQPLGVEWAPAEEKGKDKQCQIVNNL